MPKADELKSTTEDETRNESDSTRNEEDESESLEGLDELFSDDEQSSQKSKQDKEADFLAAVNKMVPGMNFKDINGLAKSLKQGRDKFREAGRQKKDEEVVKKTESTEAKETIAKIPSVVKSLYFTQYPEAKLVWQEVERAARLTGKDAFELYEEESFFQEKAQRLYEEKEQEDNDKGKVKRPMFGSEKKGSSESKLRLSEADRALLSRHKLTEKDVKTS